jgi:hypothetical protein
VGKVVKSRHVRWTGLAAGWYKISVGKSCKTFTCNKMEAAKVITVSALGIYESLRRSDANRIGC